jgi:GntR family transcriptional repressor for pyruvate dehydrogenase complex
MMVNHIRRYRLPAGAVLPSEVQISARLQVSRGSVREAYRSLSSAGIVKIANGSAPRVGVVSNRALTQILQHAVWTRQASAAQVLEMRGPIEERAAELAAMRRTNDDVDALRQAVAAMRAAKSRREPYVAADIRFHELVGLATGNPLFWLIGSALRAAMSVSIRASLAGRRSSAELGRIIGTHASIVDAIEAGRAADARQLMRRHYDEAADSIRRQELPSGTTRSTK